MALPPTIPTSFVPHVSSAPARRFRSNVTGAFGLFAYGVLGLVFVLALGVFFYGRILASSKTAKDAELAAAQAAIDPATVRSFVRLRDRLTSSNALLAKHISFSGFFSELEKILPSSVRFTALHFLLSETGASRIEGAGLAKNFNALAAASNAFAADGRIKDAIFSNISVNRDGSVSFSLSGVIELVTFDPAEAVTHIPVATSSAPLMP